VVNLEKSFAPIIEKINSANDIVLLVHENPDGDAVGSMIAFYRALTKIGKKVDGVIEKHPANCVFLTSTIGKEIKTFEEADLTKQYDLCIVLDCGNSERLNVAKDLFVNAKDTACIDHHETNFSFANANYIKPEAAATGELIFDLLNEMQIAIDTEIATALYSSIISDTGNFCHQNTTKRTFEIASSLMEYGIDVPKISYYMFNETRLNRLIFMGKILSKIEVFLDGKLSIICATQEDVDEFQIDKSELDGIVDYARYIKGVEVGILLKPRDGVYRLSMRSNGKVDLLEIAAKFNGGGHKYAAGGRVDTDSIEKAKEEVVKAFAEVL
jgi:phosphoesterase RecJ-like protein